MKSLFQIKEKMPTNINQLKQSIFNIVENRLTNELLQNTAAEIKDSLAFREEEEEKNKNNEEGMGKSNKYGDGMTINEINRIMIPIKYYCETILYTNLEHIKKYFTDANQKIYSFIMLIIKPNKNYGHFTACYIDFNNFCCEYYDWYGDHPPNHLFNNVMSEIFNDMNINRMMKYKINAVRHEKWDGVNCGWYCIDFIIKRTWGHSFINATKFHNIRANEKNMDELRKKYIKFNYI